jgi:riboflavin biosynthesis pyrimidine reductase
MMALTPLETLVDSQDDVPIPLPPELARLYGEMRMPPARQRPHIISNFVSTLDGVVSLDAQGRGSGAEISGHNAHDRMVMGVLRAMADAVVVGAGTLRSGPKHVWTAEHIYPELADSFYELRSALGKTEPPLNVIVTASGHVDLRLPVFRSGAVPVLIVTTSDGAKRLRGWESLPSTQLRTARGNGPIRAKTILAKVQQVSAPLLVLVEGGPRLLSDFYAQQLLDEQFLTIAPQVAGRDGTERPGLVSGDEFAPRRPRWGTLVDARRAGSHLFLRYRFP